LGVGGVVVAGRARQEAALGAALVAGRRAGARRLLVDVSGNGGGSEWVSEVIALMTPRHMSRAEVRVVAPACDRRGVWTGKPACSVFAAASGRATLAGTGVWSGPAFVLADRNTASAAEDLVAWLQQNRVARVIGERTMGAGCGYIDGGTRTPLRASHFDLLMPNCARFLDDGSNEIDGIAPDIAIDLHADDPGVQARRLAAALARG
jgi:C-terminal processing protease CtpA/Prc